MNERQEEIFELHLDPESTRGNVACRAGYLLGLAFEDRPLDDYDREMIARAGGTLRQLMILMQNDPDLERRLQEATNGE